MNKIKMYAAYAVGVVAAMTGAVAGAQSSLFEVPTSTVSNLTAAITSTIADPGLLLVIVFVVALPVVFWLISRIKGLFPKSK